MKDVFRLMQLSLIGTENELLSDTFVFVFSVLLLFLSVLAGSTFSLKVGFFSP